MLVKKEIKKPRDSKGTAGLFAETAGFEPARGVNPYLLSREAHSTGLCDVSSADYSKAFSLRARNAHAGTLSIAGTAEGKGNAPQSNLTCANALLQNFGALMGPIDMPRRRVCLALEIT